DLAVALGVAPADVDLILSRLKRHETSVNGHRARLRSDQFGTDQPIRRDDANSGDGVGDNIQMDSVGTRDSRHSLARPAGFSDRGCFSSRSFRDYKTRLFAVGAQTCPEDAGTLGVLGKAETVQLAPAGIRQQANLR